MNIKNLDLYNFIDSYKKGVENILRNRSVKSLEGEVLIVSKELDVKKEYKISELSFEEIKSFLENKEILYLPFVSGFDSYVIAVSGAEFDLDEGIEPEWLEGVGYIPSGSRMVDIGDYTISYKNLAGFMIEKLDSEYKILFAEIIKGNNKIKEVINAGLLGIEIKAFVEESLI